MRDAAATFLLAWQGMEGVRTRSKGLHMDTAAEMGVSEPTSPRYFTKMLAAHALRSSA